MENASKAIIMAGGILISIVIISLLVLLFGGIGGAYDAQNEALSIKQIEEYNRKFAKYNDTKGLYGSELLSLGNLVEDYNKKLAYDLNGNINDEFYKKNSIKVEVKIWNLVGEKIPNKYENGNDIKNKSGKILQKFEKGEVKGIYDIGELIKFNEDLLNLSANSSEAKSAITEFRSLPYRCDTSKTEYNEYGRIKYMYFEQVVESYEDFK